MRGRDPRGLIDKAVGACFMLLAGAAAVFFAVKLIAAVIVPLLVVVGLAAVVFVGIRLLRLRHHRW